MDIGVQLNAHKLERAKYEMLRNEAVYVEQKRREAASYPTDARRTQLGPKYILASVHIGLN